MIFFIVAIISCVPRHLFIVYELEKDLGKNIQVQGLEIGLVYVTMGQYAAFLLNTMILSDFPYRQVYVTIGTISRI